MTWLVVEQVYSIKPHIIPSSTPPISVETSARPASPGTQSPLGRPRFNFWNMSRTQTTSSTGSQRAKKTSKTPKVDKMGALIEEDEGIEVPGSKKFNFLDLQ